MRAMHVCYMDCGSIINSATGGIIEQPAILVSKADDIVYGWGNMDKVEAKFEKYTMTRLQAGYKEEMEDLMLIEFSEYKITREMACYVLRRAIEFTATGFITNLCHEITEGSDPIAWLRAEMERIPINVNQKEWK